MKMHRLAAGAALSLLLAAGALAQTQPVPGAVQANGQAAPVQATAIIVAPSGGGSGRGVVVAPDRPLPVTCISGCSGGGGGGNTSVTATAAAPSYVEGSTTNPLSTNLTGDLRTIAKQSGTWDIGTLSTVTSITNAIGIKGVNGTTIATNANPVPISDAGGSLTVDGTVAVSGSVAVTGPLTDTQLRATAVPVSGTVTANIGTVGTLATAALQSATQATYVAATATKIVQLDPTTGLPYDPATPVPVKSAAATTTDASSTVTTGGTFQTVFAANSARLGCLIQNPITASETLFIYEGTGTATTAKSINLAPGAAFSCSGPGLVVTGLVQVTAATTAHAFVAKSQ